MNPSAYRTIGVTEVNQFYGTASVIWFAQRQKTTKFLFGLITYTRWVYLTSFDYSGGESPRNFESEASAWDACKADAAAEAHGVKTTIGRVGDPLVSASVTTLGTNP